MKEVGIEFCDNKEIFYIWDDGEEAALEEREAIQNVLDKQDKG